MFDHPDAWTERWEQIGLYGPGYGPTSVHGGKPPSEPGVDGVDRVDSGGTQRAGGDGAPDLVDGPGVIPEAERAG